MANLSGFDARKVEPNSFEPIPAGDYPVVIIASEMKPTKDGEGNFLELKLQIQGGKFDKRTLFDRLNLVNKNATAVQIAKGTLSAICRAVNVLTPNDSSELHGRRMLASVAARKADDGTVRNEVKGYKPVGSAAEPSLVEQAFEPTDEAGGSASPF